MQRMRGALSAKRVCEKNLEIEVDSKLNMNQLYDMTAKKKP